MVTWTVTLMPILSEFGTSLSEVVLHNFMCVCVSVYLFVLVWPLCSKGIIKDILYT